MGRPSSSGGSENSTSGGGHSFSDRSSGGHRIGGGSSGGRPNQRTGSRNNNSGSYNHYGNNYHYHRIGSSYSGQTSPLAIVIGILVILISLIITLVSKFGDAPKSSYAREKLDAGISFTNDCIVDEIGWFDNVSKTEKQLKDFYKKTGVQPYIVLHQYDSSLTSDKAKEDWAKNYYSEHINNEGTFLYVYFAESNPDVYGYMCYVNGKQVSSVMDAEAVEIFWNYLDKNLMNDSMSTDKVFVTTFNQTAKTIMTKSKTFVDFAIYFVIGVVIIVVGVIGYKSLKAKFKRQREEAEETERILNTSIHELSNDSEADDIINRYQ